MRVQRLGGGAFGTVYEGLSSSGFFFAVKEIFILPGCNAERSKEQLQKEVSLLSRLRHKNIVRYYGTDWEEGKLNIFLELVTPGSLASLYGTYGFTDSHASKYTRQILDGLIYLHNKKIVHRDIKCANILVDTNGCVKLADFGLAKQIDASIQANSCKGTPYWMAPEVINVKPYGRPADIWSLGCTVLEMLTGKHPYPDEKEWISAGFKIGRGERPPMPGKLSDAACDFIDRCLQVDPKKRPSAKDLLKHPYVSPRFPDDANI